MSLELRPRDLVASGLSKMEAAESDVSLQLSGEADAFAPRPLLVGRGLTKIYRNGPFEVRALDDVDIELYEGEIVVFLGESGSGKSTLLNSLGGLDVPTSGLLTYENRDLTNASVDELPT